MVLFNYSTKELTAKIVYYGPGLCGKTTNLQFIHDNLPGNVKGKMLSLATKTDRTLFFDFLPIDLGEIRGMKTRVQLYTVPGQVFYNETRKLVLKGADGIVFVADSQQQMLQANVESFKNLEENLKAHGMTLAEMPHVIQFNKRDLPKLASIEELNTSVNKYNAPFYESVATTGIGVQDSLKAITKLVLLHLTRKYDPKVSATASAPAPAANPPAPPRQPQGIPVAAAAQSGAAQGIPLSPTEPPIGFGDMPAERSRDLPAPPPEPAAPQFAEDDLEGLMDEVESAPEGEPHREAAVAPAALEGAEEDFFDVPPIDLDEADAGTPAPAARFEVDHELDPEFRTAAEERAVPPSDTAPELGRDLPLEPALTEAAQDEFPADVEEPVAPAEAVEEAVATAPAEEAPATITLTEVAGDDDLFDDPSLDVARLSAGETREILIPVEVGDPARGLRRFKLSVQLRLDPLD